jgi:hypothetical protein
MALPMLHRLAGSSRLRECPGKSDALLKPRRCRQSLFQMFALTVCEFIRNIGINYFRFRDFQILKDLIVREKAIFKRLLFLLGQFPKQVANGDCGFIKLR